LKKNYLAKTALIRGTPTVLLFFLAKNGVRQLSNQYGEEKKKVLSNGLATLTCQNPKKENPAAREGRAHAGVAREMECQADCELTYMPIHPRILPS
jgi:hypothetical protein